MPTLSEANKEFRRQLSDQLRRAIGTSRGEQSRAARELGISRQRLNQYIHGAAFPKFDILARVAKHWNLRFEYGGVELPESALNAVQVRADAAEQPPRQLDLFASPQVLQYNDVTIRIQAQKREALHLMIDVKRAS